MRRGSSQSIHSEAGNAPLPTGPSTRGGYMGRGRGNSYGAPYQPVMPYSPQHSFRGAPNGRGGMQPNYGGRGGGQMQYQSSPGMGTRSPAMMNATPGTPQMNQMHMMPGMQGQPNGYYMPHQVKPHAPTSQETTRGKPGKTRGRGPSRGHGRGAVRGAREDKIKPSRDPASDYYRPELVNSVSLYPFPDLSPESGNFEHFLTHRTQGMNVPTAADPSIQIMYNQQLQYQHAMPGQYQNYMPPQSPRPPFQQGGYPMQPTYSNQGHPPAMSRQSSQMSVPERPGSSIGQQPHTPSMSTPSVQPHTAARTPSVSAPKSNFTLPPKKSAAIQIKNAAGEIVSFGKPPASPATATAPSATPVIAAPPPPPPSTTPSVPTPPSRTGSAAEVSHARTDSVSTKTAEEKKKAMQEAVKQQIEEQAKLKKMESHAEEKADVDEEARDAAKFDAEEAKENAVALEKEASEASARKDSVSSDRKESASPAIPDEESAKAADDEPKPAGDDEIDFDAIEAEMAAAEAEEARLEEEYNKKRAAEKEAQRKKEQEEAAAYETNMKEMERKAEAEEAVREKDRDAGSEDEAAKKMFADLKGGSGVETPGSIDTPAIATPGESGTATPVSEVSMPPAAKGTGPKRGKAAELTLDTKKPVEPPEPSATLKALQTAKKLENLSAVTYPSDVASPNPALNQNAPPNRGFKYDKAFLLQFQSIFKEKPSLDWDAKIRDALGDGDSSARPSGSARTPSTMGGRSMSNRPPATANAFGPMGAFGGSAQRPLPPGTTSEQRFAASNAAMRGAPVAAQNPFAQFGRGAMGTPMARNPSSNALGPIPGSPRVGGGSRGGSRAESKRSKQSTKHMGEENKSMPLTAGLSLTPLEISTTGWKPRSIGQPTLGPTPGGGETLMDPEMVQRKVKAALNKMTPEKFERIADSILEIAAQSKHEPDGRTLRQVIQLTFEKATDEAHWAPMYAMFCRKMLESMSPDIKDENIVDKNGQVVAGGNLFRKYLLNRCQEEFERGWKVNLPPRPEGQTEEAAILSDEYYIAAAAKRRGLGLVKFIGELFKLGMLTERIMHECVKKLVDYEGMPDEAEVESLTSLLRTIGKQLDDPQSKAQPRMDIYFERIKATLELPDLHSRLRYMLMDIVDLRRKGWVSKDDNKGPKTIAEIRAEAEEKARQDELQRLTQQSQRGRGGHMQMGRGDARSFSYNQLPPPDTSGRVSNNELRGLSNRPARNPSSNAATTLGPTSLGAGRTNSGRRGLGPGSLLGRGEDSGASSRTGTPPATKEKEKKDEASTNTFR
jgi:translation initiation factor 4G